MRNLSVLLIVLTSFFALPALAADAAIDIASPADGSMVKAGMQSQLVYEVTMGGEADHAHLYVDGRQAALLRQRKGSHTLDPLMPGRHEICARLVNRNHTPIGVERCIKVTAE